MKYGLLSYDENKRFFNVGDNIQSLAAKQFLPQVDAYVNRERLAEYEGEELQLIMNGWFTHNIHNWVPSDNIDPIFVSFHMNNTAAPFMLSEKGIAYLKTLIRWTIANVVMLFILLTPYTATLDPKKYFITPSIL